MIIVLGMDNTGKTTLCKELGKLNAVSVVKSCGPIDRDLQVDWVIEQIERAKQEQVVYDRFCIFEEIVYGEVLRKQSNFRLGNPIVSMLKGSKPLIVYCRPPSEVIFNSLPEREQMKGVEEQKNALLCAYDNLYFQLQGQGWNILSFDYNRHKAQAVMVGYSVHQLLSDGFLGGILDE